MTQPGNEYCTSQHLVDSRRVVVIMLKEGHFHGASYTMISLCLRRSIFSTRISSSQLYMWVVRRLWRISGRRGRSTVTVVQAVGLSWGPPPCWHQVDVIYTSVVDVSSVQASAGSFSRTSSSTVSKVSSVVTFFKYLIKSSNIDGPIRIARRGKWGRWWLTHRRSQGVQGRRCTPRATKIFFSRHFCWNEAKMGLNLVRCTHSDEIKR